MYCYCGSSPAQSRGTQDHILLSQFLRLPQRVGPRPRIYIAQEQDGPDKHPGTGFPFRRLYLQVVLALRVRVRVTLQLTVSQSVCLGVEPNLGLLTRYIFFF
jgi:hypothetical protein